MTDPLPPIPSPSHVSPVPDEATKAGLMDYTSSTAANRVLHVNLGFFKYGTCDTAHAAAVIFSVLLLIVIVALVVFSQQSAQVEKIVGWLQTTFLLTIGVALGRSTSSAGDTKSD